MGGWGDGKCQPARAPELARGAFLLRGSCSGGEGLSSVRLSSLFLGSLEETSSIFILCYEQIL